MSDSAYLSCINISVVLCVDRQGRGDSETCYRIEERPVFFRQENGDVSHLNIVLQIRRFR